MATSGTISQTHFPTRLVIEHAYRRCRLNAQAITGEMIDVALDLLYLMLSEWANKNIQLWCIEKQILSIYQGQAELPCPAGTVDILNANLRRVTYQSFTATTTSTSIIATLAIPDILVGGVNTNGIAITTVGALWNGIALPFTVSGRLDPSLPWNLIGTVYPDTTLGPKTWTDFDGVAAYKYYWLALAVPNISLSVTATRGDQRVFVTDGANGNVAAAFLNAGSFTVPNEPAGTTFTVLTAVYDPLNQFTIVSFTGAISQASVSAGTGLIVNARLALTPSTLYLCNSPYEITIARINRDDYINLPNKTFQGPPLQYWYDRQRDTPIMTLWPAPDAGSAQDQITIWRKRQIMDVGKVNQFLDIPQRWYDAVVYNLAFRLAEERPEVDANLIPVLTQRAQMALLSAQAEERDSSPIYWSPNLRVYTR